MLLSPQIPGWLQSAPDGCYASTTTPEGDIAADWEATLTWLESAITTGAIRLYWSTCLRHAVERWQTYHHSDLGPLGPQVLHEDAA